MIVNSESLYETKPLVTVKGTREGLLFLLDETADIDSLCVYVEQLLTGESGKVFDGPNFEIVVDYGRRVLTPADAGRILQMFLARPNFIIKAWGGGTSARQSLFKKGQVLRKQTIYHGVVRAGEPFLFDGDVVIIGDVNPSAQVQATGDIYVFGRLLGIAHAGVDGDEGCVIAATEFAPMQLRIADIVSRAPKVDDNLIRTMMEFAYLDHGRLAVAQMKYFMNWRKSRHLHSKGPEKGSRL